MKKLLLILASLLLVSIIGCGTGDSVLGPTTDDQIQANDSGDKTETPSTLTTGDPWDDEEFTGSGSGNSEESEQCEEPDDPDDPVDPKDPDIYPEESTGGE